jgi:tripartite-type tricarboxylate transporter receptor subunit TctC
MILRRVSILTAALIAASFATTPQLSTSLAAGNYPDHSIRLIVPFPAGGINDVLGRLWADKITPLLGTVVVENRSGGGSMIGSAEVARATADGYTLLLGNSTNQVLNPQLMRTPPFDPAKDFAAISILATIPNVIAVNPSLPVRNLKELADYARSHPGKLSYGSAGIGTMTHLSGELFKKLAGGLDIVHVPYRGGAPAIADITSGTLPVVSLSVAAQLLALHRAGKIRILCVNARTRVDVAPDISTAVEAGFPGMVVEVFNGLFAPAGTPKSILDRIASDTKKVMTDPGLQKVLKEAGGHIVQDSDPDKAARYVVAERDRWTPVISASGIPKR